MPYGLRSSGPARGAIDIGASIAREVRDKRIAASGITPATNANLTVINLTISVYDKYRQLS